MADLETGSEFAGCRIEGVLGRGGMGVIYRATELRLGRAVALKLIATEQASDPDVRERFEREARMTASIEHPNVVPVYAAGEEGKLLRIGVKTKGCSGMAYDLKQKEPVGLNLEVVRTGVRWRNGSWRSTRPTGPTS